MALLAPTDRHAPTHPVRCLLEEHRWIHLGVGILGNALFLVGSVLFLWETTEAVGVWLFIVGAAAMLAGSIGSAIVRLAPDGDDGG